MERLLRDEERREQRDAGEMIRIEQAVSDKKTSSAGYHEEASHMSQLPSPEPSPLGQDACLPTPSEPIIDYS